MILRIIKAIYRITDTNKRKPVRISTIFSTDILL